MERQRDSFVMTVMNTTRSSSCCSAPIDDVSLPEYELREDYFELERSQHYVVPENVGERIRFINLLEEKGFAFPEEKHRDKQACTDSLLPLVVNTEDKSVRTMGNVTVAACAATAKVLTDVDTFIECFLT